MYAIAISPIYNIPLVDPKYCLRWLDLEWLITLAPSGNDERSYRNSALLLGKPTISMAMFNSYISHYQRVYPTWKISAIMIYPKKKTWFSSIFIGKPSIRIFYRPTWLSRGPHLHCAKPSKPPDGSATAPSRPRPRPGSGPEHQCCLEGWVWNG